MQSSAAPRPSLLRRVVANFAFLLNIGVAAWALLCFAAGYVSGAMQPLLQLFSITTPFALAANVFFLFFWLLARRKWRMALPVFTLALCHKLLLGVVGWHFMAVQDMKPGPARLKVMTWNAHGLGIFRRPISNNDDRKVMDFIRQENPDLLCLPEFYTLYNDALKPYATTILAENGYREYRFRYDNTLGTRIYLGTAVFSKYPIRQFRYIMLASHVYLLESDVELPGGRMVRLYCVHLQSFRLPDKDKSLLEDARNNHDLEAARGKGFIRKFAWAYRARARQADTAAQIMLHSPYPVIVCGDFNDLPGSYVYSRMRGRLYDAFEKHGAGLGRTYNMFSPTLRIDHIFYDPKLLHIIGLRTPQTVLSDHNPVIANFEVK